MEINENTLITLTRMILDFIREKPVESIALAAILCVTVISISKG